MTPLAEGRIDLHSHLLPGIDDGCQTLAQSLACVRRLKARGYVGTVCTPHVLLDLFPMNTPANIALAVTELQAELDREGLDYRLWPGGELRIDKATVTWLEAVGVPTLAGSRVVLFDWWGRTWPDFADDLCSYLLDRGYEPVLAHPERMGLDAAELEAVLSALEKRGIGLQGNLNSLSGGEGPVASNLSWRLLKENRYRFLASDMHRPESLDGRLAGLDLLEQTLGQAALKPLLEDRPRALVQSPPAPMP